MTGLETFGINTATSAANGLIGAGLGIATAKWNDQRQLSMQQKLMAMQEAANNRAADKNQQRNKDMWDYTNYENQLKHMEAAGLNPALMYGQGGGGGSTASGGQQQGVSGGQAPTGGGEIGMGIQSVLQSQMMQAQIELAKSQANKNNVEAENAGGVVRENIAASTENLWQGLENARNANDIQRLQKTMMNIENFEKQASQEDRLNYISYQAKVAEQQLKSATAGAKIDTATVDSKIKIIRQEAIGAMLKNALTSAQTDATRTGIQVDQQKIKESANNILMSWETLSNEHKKIFLQEQMTNFSTDYNREAINQMVNTINSLIHVIPK